MWGHGCIRSRHGANDRRALHTNGAPDTFVRDRVTERTERVSLASDGTQANSYNGNHMMSAVLTIRGAWLAPDAVVVLGDGITVRTVRLANPTTLRVGIDIAASAATGPRSGLPREPGKWSG